MNTLTEIEDAVEALPRPQQETLLRHLEAKLRGATQFTAIPRQSWPVPPPLVSEAESQRIAQFIEEEFGRIDGEMWQ